MSLSIVASLCEVPEGTGGKTMFNHRAGLRQFGSASRILAESRGILLSFYPEIFGRVGRALDGGSRVSVVTIENRKPGNKLLMGAAP